MENGWYFPKSFEEWKENGNGLIGIETELENASISNDLLVSQPVEVEQKPKKKKKKRPQHYETFEDRYMLSNEVLGRGANSLVALAVEKSSQKQFAVKIIEKYEGYDRGRVLREIDLLHFLGECPNILHLHDFYEEKDKFFLVFERMEGGPLLDHIQHKKYFTEKEASLVVKNIASALKFLHDKGIAHRDLKPDNILCINKDSIVPVVICDFNLASGISMIGSATTPELYTPVGSAEYMAPEIVDAFVGDAPAYDKRCDLWSLGVILYIALSGQPPFQGNCGEKCDWKQGGACRSCQSMLWHSILDADYSFPEDEWSNVSIEAKDLISHLLVKEASKRYTVEMVLSHPWLEMASNNQLNTPVVLSSDTMTHRLSAVTSEAVLYRRIISERQRNQEKEQCNIITRWSTPPKFGLSPPGNSRLAKRRSLKNKIRPLSSPPLAMITPTNNPHSPNRTPTQSPDIQFLIEEEFRLRLTRKESDKDHLNNQDRNKTRQCYLNLSQDEFSSDNITPVATPRGEYEPSNAII